MCTSTSIIIDYLHIYLAKNQLTGVHMYCIYSIQYIRLYTVQSTITDSILLNGVDLDDILEEAFQNAARIVEESGENHFTKLLLAKL